MAQKLARCPECGKARLSRHSFCPHCGQGEQKSTRPAKNTEDQLQQLLEVQKWNSISQSANNFANASCGLGCLIPLIPFLILLWVAFNH